MKKLFDNIVNYYTKKRDELEKRMHPIKFIIIDSLMDVFLFLGAMILMLAFMCSVVLIIILLIAPFIFVNDNNYGEFWNLGILGVYIWVSVTISRIIGYYKEEN